MSCKCWTESPSACELSKSVLCFEAKLQDRKDHFNIASLSILLQDEDVPKSSPPVRLEASPKLERGVDRRPKRIKLDSDESVEVLHEVIFRLKPR